MISETLACDVICPRPDRSISPWRANKIVWPKVQATVGNSGCGKILCTVKTQGCDSIKNDKVFQNGPESCSLILIQGTIPTGFLQSGTNRNHIFVCSNHSMIAY